MKQNFDNHVRWSLPYHFIFVPLLLTSTGLAIYNFINDVTLSSGLIVVIFILIGFAGGFARHFALIVQDRTVRAEESLRYYVMTYQVLPTLLHMSQILALRFASDDEFVELVQRTIKENLAAKQIKLSVKSWRGDYHRV